MPKILVVIALICQPLIFTYTSQLTGPRDLWSNISQVMPKKMNERLQLAINVLNLDLPKARRGALLTAKEDLVAFLGQGEGQAPSYEGGVRVFVDTDASSPGSSLITPILYPDSITNDQLAVAQAKGLKFLSAFRRRSERDIDWIEPVDDPKKRVYLTESERIPVKGFFTVMCTTAQPPDADEEPRLEFTQVRILTANLGDGFVQALSHLVTDPDTDTGPLRTCPICTRFFLRTRRQDYCTPKCQNVKTSRAWLKKNPTKSQARKRSRKTTRE